MDESTDLSDITDFVNSISGDFASSFKAVNAPSSTPVPGAAVPGRPGYVYGAGGAIYPVNPATGLPVVNSTPVGGTSSSTIFLLIAVAVLVTAFIFARK